MPLFEESEKNYKNIFKNQKLKQTHINIWFMRRIIPLILYIEELELCRLSHFTFLALADNQTLSYIICHYQILYCRLIFIEQVTINQTLTKLT